MLSAILVLLIGCCILQTAGPLSLAEMAAHLGLGGAGPGGPPDAGAGRVVMAEDAEGAEGRDGAGDADGAVLGPAQLKLIQDYMDAYFGSLAKLEVDFPDALFALGNGAQAERDRAVWEIAVGIRKMQVVDLRLARYSYKMVCTRVDQEGDGDVTVHLVENNVQNFREYPGVDSESRNIDHRFTLTQEDGTWYIAGHGGGGAVSRLVARRPGHPTDIDVLDEVESVPEMIELVLGDAEENVVQRVLQDHFAETTAPAVMHAYDREAAVAYAVEWCFTRNPKWPVYDDEGGNCANFTSQCLLAGGIPMDYRGPSERQWKWYGETANYSQRPRGRSPSWASVDWFHRYATSNIGFGLVCEADAPYYSGEPGDVLQLGFLGDWRHNVLITEVIRGRDGSVIDYLVCSNTADQRDFPASAYLYTMQRVIKVWGWRE